MCYFAIILTHSTCTQTTNYPETKLVGVPFKLRKRMKNSLSCVHVLHKTLNLVISRCCFAGDDKEMYQNVKARAERLFLLIKPFVLWRCRRRRRGIFVRSLMSMQDGRVVALLNIRCIVKGYHLCRFEVNVGEVFTAKFKVV